MGFIGVQPATVPLTANDITDGIISTAKIADDAVGNTKLDLSANYAFTGTVTGASSGLVKVLSATWSSPVAEYDITSSTLTSTYDNYLIVWRITPSTDNTTMYGRFSTDGGSSFISSSGYYAYEFQNATGSVTLSSNSQTYMVLSYNNSGNSTGEHMSGQFYLRDINNTSYPSTLFGSLNYYTTSGNHGGGIYSGGQTVANRGDNVDGFRFATASGNLENGEVTVYGLTK